MQNNLASYTTTTHSKTFYVYETIRDITRSDHTTVCSTVSHISCTDDPSTFKCENKPCSKDTLKKYLWVPKNGVWGSHVGARDPLKPTASHTLARSYT